MGSPTIAVGLPEPVIINRMTRGGRQLWYHLDVIQQPERARACGAGPKSSADRRPVDPPPVVELRIFEGPTMELAKDITFTYDANFFLFATLEHARVLAHGRVQTPSAATPPVLTGMPVSGMAYLDRPKEAGYFLFPDLSVRHEGRYRLTFNLYEQTKEAADLDKDMHDSSQSAESFAWRMEVKSNDFMVFSAKKFPGLTESTALSRTVAEQGCRVRIRRDVRMRRREGKSSAAAAPAVGNADARTAAEEEFARHRRTQTPEVAPDYRQRSMSIDSNARTPYSSDPSCHAQRRPSVNEYAPSPSAGPSMPPAFHASAAQPGSSSHLRFGAAHPNSFIKPSSIPPSPTFSHLSYGQAPQQQQGPPPPPPQQQQQQQQHSHHAQHHSSSSFSAPCPSPSSSAPSSHAYYQDRPASQHYTTTPASSVSGPVLSPKRESFSSDYRRPSISYGSPPTPVEHSSDVRRIEVNSLTLPPLSELINYKGDKQSPPTAAVAPNSDRVSTISQLLQPQSQSVLPHPGTGAASLQKKRSYGQYNNLDMSSDAYVTTPSVKNHARQAEATPRECEELWWKRADGSVWTPHGEVMQQRA